VLLIVLTGGFIKYNSLHNKYNSYGADLINTEELLEETRQNLSFFELKSEADELFINHEFDEALDVYQRMIKDDSANIQLLSGRLQRMSELKKLEDTLLVFNEKHKKLLVYIDSLYNTIDDWEDRFVEEKLDLLKNYDYLEHEYTSVEKIYEELQSRYEEIEKNRNILSFKNVNGNIVHYIGDLDDNKAHGYGIGIWETGGVYKGDWRNNMRHGKGRYEWVDGEIYEGDFINDQRNGYGTYYFKNGERYIGEWKNNKRHGKGKILNKQDELMYEGYWENDNYTTRNQSLNNSK
jgi:hypothetical protein